MRTVTKRGLEHLVVLHGRRASRTDDVVIEGRHHPPTLIVSVLPPPVARVRVRRKEGGER